MQGLRRLVQRGERSRRGAGAAGWGGYLLHEPTPNTLAITLTGCLTSATIAGVDRRLRWTGRPDAGTRFVVLDGSHLGHIPLDSATRLLSTVAGWRQRGWVVLAAGFSPYLANLLILACSGDELFPVFADLTTALDAAARVGAESPGIAQQRLSAWGGLRH